MATNWSKTMQSNLLITTVMDLIKYPVITEKSYLALSKNSNKQYTFNVDLRLTKPQIKDLFETFFNINVIAVNTHIPPRKMKRLGSSARSKRAILTLKEGQSISYLVPRSV